MQLFPAPQITPRTYKHGVPLARLQVKMISDDPQNPRFHYLTHHPKRHHLDEHEQNNVLRNGNLRVFFCV